MLVPYRKQTMQRELQLFFGWYNGLRPHTSLNARTPDEVYFKRFPVIRHPRWEPRERWPRGSPCAQPRAPTKGRPGQRLELQVTYHAGRKNLPIVSLVPAA